MLEFNNGLCRACAGCGAEESKEVKIGMLGEGDFVTVPLCEACEATMPFNLEPFFGCTVDRADYNTALSQAVSAFVSNVWSGEAAPSYQQLSEVFNSAGVMTQSGARWTAANLRQKCVALQCEPRSLYTPHFATKAAQSTIWLEAASEAAAAHGEFGPDMTAGWGEMPSGVPGMEVDV